MSQKSYVIVDIDGTVANLDHRLHHIQTEDGTEATHEQWEKFYQNCVNDQPEEEIIQLVESLEYNYYQIIFCTGRPETYREETTKWIQRNIDFQESFGFDLVMREEGDLRHDSQVKPEILFKFLNKENISKDEILFIIEDRDSMVKKWRDIGFRCIQVAEGKF